MPGLCACFLPERALRPGIAKMAIWRQGHDKLPLPAQVNGYWARRLAFIMANEVVMCCRPSAGTRLGFYVWHSVFGYGALVEGGIPELLALWFGEIVSLY